MLTLVTSNPKKYATFARELERWRLAVETPKAALPEIQVATFAEVLAVKAQAAFAMFGHPVLVDDSGLVLSAYPTFPGPLTSVVLRSLGVQGLKRLLSGVSDAATMECHIGCWIDGALRSWSGKVEGRIDFTREPGDPRMILTDVFVTNDGQPNAGLRHRAAALAALERDIFDLHLRVSKVPPVCDFGPSGQCPFCIEIDDPSLSIFSEMMAGRLDSRVIYEDEHFLVVPALGQFTEGGLLLLSRAHIPSFAHLAPELYPALERLTQAVVRATKEKWGIEPLVFEHGPAPRKSKGGCCVDHAHFNIFPARARVEPRLSARMRMPITGLAELERMRAAVFGYFFVQENDGSRHVFDGQDAPSQLVRRIITAEIGKPERWHWRDYPGYDELIATYRALKGRL
jgi:XTP/dITP diphosphohydrolase